VERAGINLKPSGRVSGDDPRGRTSRAAGSARKTRSPLRKGDPGHIEAGWRVDREADGVHRDVAGERHHEPGAGEGCRIEPGIETDDQLVRVRRVRRRRRGVEELRRHGVTDALEPRDLRLRRNGDVQEHQERGAENDLPA